jgi:hypothetical protein
MEILIVALIGIAWIEIARGKRPLPLAKIAVRANRRKYYRS